MTVPPGIVLSFDVPLLEFQRDLQAARPLIEQANRVGTFYGEVWAADVRRRRRRGWHLRQAVELARQAREAL